MGHLSPLSIFFYSALVGLKKILTVVYDPRNVMSSQEVIDFIQSKISQCDENGELRLLSSIVEEVSPRVESGCLVCVSKIFSFSLS